MSSTVDLPEPKQQGAHESCPCQECVRGGLEEGRAHERALIVAWLRSLHSTQEQTSWAPSAATRIEALAHHAKSRIISRLPPGKDVQLMDKLVR